LSTGADPASAVVAALAGAGTRLVFGVPGGGPNLDVVGAAAAAGLRFVLARGETAATIMAALARWERRPLALGRALLARCREIGDSSQFGGTFRAGDQRLIFGLYGPGN
jgi:hypothetical protein